MAESAATDALVAVAPVLTRWIERLLATHDPPLTLAQYLGLRSVSQGSLSAAGIARQSGVSEPAVSQLLAGLDAAGWVHRSAVPGDRRRQTLTLSVQGRRTLSSAERLVRRRVGALLEHLPRPQIEAIGRSLPAVEVALSGQAPPRRPPRGQPPSPPRPPH